MKSKSNNLAGHFLLPALSVQKDNIADIDPELKVFGRKDIEDMVSFDLEKFVEDFRTKRFDHLREGGLNGFRGQAEEKMDAIRIALRRMSAAISKG